MLLTYILNNVPTGELHWLQMSDGTELPLTWTRVVTSWSPHGSGYPLHITVIRQSSIDCWHLVEAVGSDNSSISRCNVNGSLFENLPASEKIQTGSGTSQVFACHMSSVILTDIIQTVLETSDCFLSNTNNNMHILATMTAEQAVHSGHLFTQATQYCLCSHQKLMKETPIPFWVELNQRTPHEPS